MWGCKTRTIPVINGALGTLEKRSDINLKLLPAYPTVNEVQKIALIGTTHIL